MFSFRFPGRAALVLCVLIPFAPARAETLGDATLSTPREKSVRHMARIGRHARQRADWWLSASGLSFSLTRPAPPGIRGLPRSAALSPPFEAPARFQYRCADPPGVFPAVAACRGRWIESAATSGPTSTLTPAALVPAALAPTTSIPASPSAHARASAHASAPSGAPLSFRE